MKTRKEQLIDSIIKKEPEIYTKKYLNSLTDEGLASCMDDCELCPCFKECEEAHDLGCNFRCRQFLEIWLMEFKKPKNEKSNKEIYVEAIKTKYPDTTASMNLPVSELMWYHVDFDCKDCPAAKFCYKLKKAAYDNLSCENVIRKFLK